jgi:hypothetical protein
MRPRPVISLIAAGATAALLSIACGDGDPTGRLPPRPPMFTTIEGVVRFMDTLPVTSWPDSVWLDSIPVAGVLVRAKELLLRTSSGGQTRTYTTLDSTSTGLNGEYHIEFTASCVRRTIYYLTVDSYGLVLDPQSGRPSGLSFSEVCSVPNIQHDLWVVPY